MTDPTVLQVYVKGTPRPQPRPRFINGKVVSTASKPAKAYRAVVLAACKAVYAQCGQIKGPVQLDLNLYFGYGSAPDRAARPSRIRRRGNVGIRAPVYPLERTPCPPGRSLSAAACQRERGPRHKELCSLSLRRRPFETPAGEHEHEICLGSSALDNSGTADQGRG